MHPYRFTTSGFICGFILSNETQHVSITLKENMKTESHSQFVTGGNACQQAPASETSAPKMLLTVRDCAAMTSLSEKTILRLLQRGKLRCLTSIRHKRIPVAELARFIRENMN